MIVANQLKRNGQKLNEVRIIKKTLHSVDLKFDYIVVTIKETKDLDAIMIEQLQGRL